MEGRKISEQEAFNLIAAQIEAQRGRLRFVRSSIFFTAGALAIAVTTAAFVIRHTSGADWSLPLTLAGVVCGLVLLLIHHRRHRTVTAADRTLMNVWGYALGICLYTVVYTDSGDDLQLPIAGMLAVGAAISAGVTGELFRRNTTNKSNQPGSLVGMMWISLGGAFLAAWIIRSAAAGATVMEFALTLAAILLLCFGTGFVLRHNERRDRV